MLGGKAWVDTLVNVGSIQTMEDMVGVGKMGQDTAYDDMQHYLEYSSAFAPE